VVVLTKTDLSKSPPAEGQTYLTADKVTEAAKADKAFSGVLETSAKTNDNVTEAFEKIAGAACGWKTHCEQQKKLAEEAAAKEAAADKAKTEVTKNDGETNDTTVASKTAASTTATAA